MSIEQEAKVFMEQLQQVYYVDRDLNKTLSLMDKDVRWIGSGQAEICRGLEQAKALLEKEQAEFYNSFQILKSSYEAVALSKEFCFVWGFLTIQEKAPYTILMELNVRVSAICRKTDQGLRLYELHMSLPSADQDDSEFFPKKLAKEANRKLELLLAEKSEEIEARNRDLKNLMQNVPGGIFRCLDDESLTIRQMSDGFLSMFGYTREDIKNRFHNSFLEMIAPEDREKALQDAADQTKNSDRKELQYRVVCADGSLMWVLDKGQLYQTGDGQRSFYCVLVDITEQKKDQEEIRRMLERHQIIMNQANDIIFEWDILKDGFVFSNNWMKKFGYEPLTTRVRECFLEQSHVHPEDRRLFTDAMDSIRAGIPYTETTIRIENGDQKYLWCRVRMTGQFDRKGRPFKAVGVIVDIDSEKKQSQLLTERAERDTLTKLYNKGTAQVLIEQHLATCRDDALNAVLIIDVDNFKQINDSKGHLFGDAYLSEIARRIKKLFREQDVVGRIGGDEFIVFMKDITDPELAKRRAGQILEEFAKLSVKDIQSQAASCSIGIVVARGNSMRFKDLFQRADMALYSAKKQGKRRFMAYDDSMVQGFAGESAAAAPHSAVGDVIDSENPSPAVTSTLVENIFRILYEAPDIEAAVGAILEIVGRQYDVSRVYIFENTEDDQYCSNTFEWCNDGVEPEIQHLKRVSYQEDLKGHYLDNFNKNGVFYCRDIRTLPQEQYAILHPQGIQSLLQCAIQDNGRVKGYVGFDECRHRRFWTQEQIDTLSLISEILSVFLLKKRAQDSLEKVVAGMQTVLDNQSSWVYVIDPDSYQMWFVNQKTVELVPGVKTGDFCYRAFFGRETPCEHCPAREFLQGNTSSTEIYNPQLNVWSCVDVSKIHWENKPALLLSCYDITRYKVQAE